MKKFDSARFQNAFEKSPETFHETTAKTLDQLESPRRSVRPYKAAILVASLILLFAGVSIAMMGNTALTDFLGITQEQVPSVVISEVSLEGKMERLKVDVHDAYYDGLFLRMTVRIALNASPNDTLLYADPNYTSMPVPSFHPVNTIFAGDLLEPQENKDSILYIPYDAETALKGETLYLFSIPRLSIKDSEGIPHHIDIRATDYRYESPSSLVLYLQADLRGEDKFPLSNGVMPDVSYGNPLPVDLHLRLAVYNPDSLDPFYPCIESGAFSIAVTAPDQDVERFSLKDYPESIAGTSIVHARLTQTPMAYYLRIDMKRAEPFDPNYFCHVELYDSKKNILSSFYTVHTTLSQRSDIDDYCEIVCGKESNNPPAFIGFTSYEAPDYHEGKTVYIPLSLEPLD